MSKQHGFSDYKYKTKTFIAHWGKTLWSAFVVVMFMSSVGWFSDTVMSTENSLLPNLLALFKNDQWTRLILPLCFLFGFGALLYRLRKTFLPVRNLEPVVPESAHHKEGLIFILSSINNAEFLPKKNEQGLWTIQNQAVFSGELDKDIEVVKGIGGFSWIKLLCAIQPHLSTLRHMHLIASTGDKGSAMQLKEAEAVLKHYLTDQIEISSASCSFDSIQSIYQEVELGLKRFKKEHIEVKNSIIDITGGPKITSIAGAMATLAHPGLMFQYLDNNNVFSAYDAVTPSLTDFE